MGSHPTTHAWRVPCNAICSARLPRALLIHLSEFGVQIGQLQTEKFNSCAARISEVTRRQWLRREEKNLKILAVSDGPLGATNTLAKLA
jgi:hypothetical protein